MAVHWPKGPGSLVGSILLLQAAQGEGGIEVSEFLLAGQAGPLATGRRVGVVYSCMVKVAGRPPGGCRSHALWQ